MAKKVTVQTVDGQEIEYTMIETAKDIIEDAVFCYAPPADLIAAFNEGKTIIINRAGGYCFFNEDYHKIV